MLQLSLGDGVPLQRSLEALGPLVQLALASRKQGLYLQVASASITSLSGQIAEEA